MSSTFETPLTAAPQTLTVAIAGTSSQLRLLYQNVDQGGWTLDISDSAGPLDPVAADQQATAEALEREAHGRSIADGALLVAKAHLDARTAEAVEMITMANDIAAAATVRAEAAEAALRDHAAFP